MPPPNPITESWSPEPELRDPPPRRSAPLDEDYPDLNRPSMLLYAGAGGAILVVGLILLFVGFGGHKVGLGIVGIVLALGGAVLAGLYPAKTRSHEERIQNLITYGVPVIARVLQADNMTGKTYERSLKYQLVLPGGEMTHRSVNCDERRMSRSIPCDATALMDMKTGDAELYCALPMRALPKGEAVSRASFVPTTTPSTTTATAGTMPMTPAYSGTPATEQPATMASVAAQPTTLGGQFGDTLVSPTATVANVDAEPPADGHMGTLTVDARPVRPAVPIPDETPPTPEVPEVPEEAPKPKKPAGGMPWE